MNTIFVNICSYRDKLLELTLMSLIANESGRNQITYGIFEQNTLEESLITTNPKLLESPFIRYKRIDPEFTDGVVWARKINSLQIHNEQFMYQIDSHMIFDKDWDHFLILDYNLASQIENSKKIILTSSTKNFDFRDNVVTKFIISDDITTDIRYFSFKKDLKLRSHGIWRKSDDNIKESKHIFAGNFFTTADWLKDVDYKTDIFFEGEEQMMVLSSFLKGYKIYTQRKIKTYHYIFTEKLDTKPYINPIVNLEKLNWLENRSKQFLIDYIYSLDEKTLKAFQEKMGVDYINREISANTNLINAFLN